MQPFGSKGPPCTACEEAPFASDLLADAIAHRGRWGQPACAILRPARWRLKASEARISVRIG
eukprot:5915218-Prymnesium_polylepis.1